MTLDEKINQLEKRIAELSQPPVQHEDIELTISTENCETHGPFECRTRHFLNSVVKIPPRPSCCPECLKEELGRLQAERVSINEAARKRNIERLLDGLNIPARFENCTLQNYEPVNDDAKRALKVCRICKPLARAFAEGWRSCDVRQTRYRKESPGTGYRTACDHRTPEFCSVYHGAENCP